MIEVDGREYELVDFESPHVKSFQSINSLFLRYTIHILHIYIHIHDIGHERTHPK